MPKERNRAPQPPMGKERRRAPRIKVNLRARWEGNLGQQEASVTSLSAIGCFVLSGGKVEPKELIRLEIMFPDDAPIYMWAEVVEEAEEIGFSMQFTSVEEADQARLTQYVQRYLTAES